MGIIKRGILGGYSNKVGNVVGSSWKGIATMRVLPLSVANPRTAAQVSNRNAFAAVTAFASSILTSIVKPLNDRFALRMSGFNAFVQRNKAAFADPLNVDTSAIVLSRGRLSAPVVTSETGVSGNVAAVYWNTALGGAMDMATDLAYILLLNEDGVAVGASSGAVSRSVGNVSIPFPAGEDVYYIYLSFLRADGTEVSPSTMFAI